MKNSILVVTSVYPTSAFGGLGATKVVHYYAKEWVKMGYTVNVINNINKYPIIFYLIPKFFREFMANKLGFIAPSLNDRKQKSFVLDGVNVFCLPIKKNIPFGKYSKKVIARQIKDITSLLKKNNIEPQIITGHWENPQILIIPQINEIFRAKTALVLHGIHYINRYSNFSKEIYLFDKIGFRNKPTRMIFEKIIPDFQGFYCYSGIPNEYISDNVFDVVNNKFRSEYIKCVYAGHLIKRKHIDKTIKAISSYNSVNSYELKIIGSGPEKKNLQRITLKYDIHKKISFIDNINREEVIQVFKDSDCFIMISEKEVFGLVYLEAMSQGMIVIASRNEGMTGIIEDGFNGFLCSAGDEDELLSIFQKIELLSIVEKQEIAINAIHTAKQFVDSKVAKDYLDNIKS